MVATDLVFNGYLRNLYYLHRLASYQIQHQVYRNTATETKFDDRATTKTSLALKSCRNNGNQTSRISTLNEPQPNGGGGSGEDDEILLKDIFNGMN